MTTLVTGANRGIGLAFVRQLLGRGEEVLATARRPARAEELGALTAEYPERLRLLPLDVGDEDSLEALQEQLEGVALDMLINNAGVYPSSGALGSLDYQAIEHAFRINALGPLRVVEAAWEALDRGQRRIIANITSKMGSLGDNTSGGSYGYRMSKAALNMATRSMAHDLAGEGFTVLVLHPGWVQTEMGGPRALIDTEQSVEGMLRAIERAEAQGLSGRFFEWSGGEVPW